MFNSDAVNECYNSLVGEVEADTCCKRICVMICRMQKDPSCLTHELHFMVLASQLLSNTKTFGRYIAELDGHIRQGDYAAALRIGEVMVEHEAMLHEIAAGKPLRYKASIN